MERHAHHWHVRERALSSVNTTAVGSRSHNWSAPSTTVREVEKPADAGQGTGADLPEPEMLLQNVFDSRKGSEIAEEGVSLRSVPRWSVAELSRRAHVPESEVRPMLERFVALGILLEIAPGEYAVPEGDGDKAEVLGFLDDE